MKNEIILMTLSLAALAPLSARADSLDVNFSGEIRLGRRPPPPPPVVVVVTPDPRPSRSWDGERRNRWYQRSHGYYYYPGGDAYYRSADHMWFYQERGQWRSDRRLPDSIHIDFNQSVTLTMYTDRPYTHHREVATRYPSNYFGTRVRVRDDDRHDRDHDGNRGRGSDRDHDNRGRDRGRDRDRDGRR